MQEEPIWLTEVMQLETFIYQQAKYTRKYDKFQIVIRLNVKRQVKSSDRKKTRRSLKKSASINLTSWLSHILSLLFSFVSIQM